MASLLVQSWNLLEADPAIAGAVVLLFSILAIGYVGFRAVERARRRWRRRPARGGRR